MTSSDLWDEETARRYDEVSAEMSAPAVLGPAVEFLARLAGSGDALEFAIGTGCGARRRRRRFRSSLDRGAVHLGQRELRVGVAETGQLGRMTNSGGSWRRKSWWEMSQP